MKKLQTEPECGKLIVKDGWLMCPSCRRRKVLQVRPETSAKNLIGLLPGLPDGDDGG